MLGCLERYPGLLPSSHLVDILSYVVTGKALTAAIQYNCKPRTVEIKEYIIRFVRHPIDHDYARGDNLHSSSVTMIWKKQRSVKCSIVLQVLNIGSDGKYFVCITQEGICSNIRSTPLHPIDGEDYGLLVLDEPVEFSNRSDTVCVAVTPPHVPCAMDHYLGIIPNSILPDGFAMLAELMTFECVSQYNQFVYADSSCIPTLSKKNMHSFIFCVVRRS